MAISTPQYSFNYDTLGDFVQDTKSLKEKKIFNTSDKAMLYTKNFLKRKQIKNKKKGFFLQSNAARIHPYSKKEYRVSNKNQLKARYLILCPFKKTLRVVIFQNEISVIL